MKPTACTERNRTMEFAQLNQEKDSPFSVQGIRFFPEAQASLAAALRSQGYEWIVQDFGVLSAEVLPEFAGCNIRLVILNGSPWKIHLQETVFGHLFPFPDQSGPIILLGNPAPGQKLPKNSCFSSYSVIPVPDLSNPFQITSDKFSFFEKIITGV